MPYKNILQIDDDDEDLEIFHSAVTELNNSATCLAINNTPEAMEKLVNGTVKPDIIFLDLNMPVLSGLQFLKEIKKDAVLRDIPVVIFSTTSDANTMQLTKELGAHEFITKPNRFGDLLTALKPLLC